MLPAVQNYSIQDGRFILHPRTRHANPAQNYSWVPCRFCLRSVNRWSIMTQNLGSLPQPKCNVNVYYLSVLGPICLRLKTRRAIMDPKFGRLDTRQALCCNYYVAPCRIILRSTIRHSNIDSNLDGSPQPIVRTIIFKGGIMT